MGASLPARNDRERADGLAPGLALHIRYEASSGLQQVTTRIEDVDDSGISVLVPMEKLKRRPLPSGRTVEVHYTHRNRWLQFLTEVTGHSKDGQFDFLSVPQRVESSDRRRYYRLQTAIKPTCVFRIVVGEGTEENPGGQATLGGSIIDLSEGGLCLSTRDKATVGERLGIQMVLSDAGELTVRMRVTSIDEPERGRVNRRLHCEFTGITLGDRDRIARYLMKRQIEMRRRGQL
ncbi:MAG: flagellar brake protein [Dehalococcoidia bacterium]|nr:flagellar brake protein [Dehalococcoidia bacterium]MCA9843525.1 flagellar brake protein [Dehalococcoidia bacterium]MCA9852694.1 flagellar brake protein [Dehalococcoidia bacterium]